MFNDSFNVSRRNTCVNLEMDQSKPDFAIWRGQETGITYRVPTTRLSIPVPDRFTWLSSGSLYDMPCYYR